MGEQKSVGWCQYNLNAVIVPGYMMPEEMWSRPKLAGNRETNPFDFSCNHTRKIEVFFMTIEYDERSF